MKNISLIAVIVALCSTACHNSDKTDESKPYGTTDTTKVEPKNSHADSSHHD